MDQIRWHGLMGTSVPGRVRGRELAREAIVSAVYNVPDSTAVGIGPAVGEALLPFIQTGDNDALVGLVVEMRIWAEIAVQLAAAGHGVTVEDIVRMISNVIDSGEPK
jgi:hypothetical protein